MTDEKFSTLRPLDALSPRGLAGKREYVIGLEARADAGAVASLVECLEDESGYMRDQAEAALVRLGATPEPIIPLLAHGLWYTRVSAARTLGRLRARVAVEGLVELLGDANHSAAQEGARALVRVAQDGGAVAVARTLYRRGEIDRTTAIAHLRAVDRETARTIEDLWSRREVMQADDEDLLSHDVAVVRASDESVAWDVLTRDAKA
jgi:HEAT repeat protein